MSDHHPLAGPTGQFPEGKRNDHDRGELRVVATLDREANAVCLDLGVPVAWLSVGPEGARAIALTLLRLASQLDGQILTVMLGEEKLTK